MQVVVDWEACTSPVEYADLPDGQWLFSVRATAAGSPPSVPDGFPFTVDATPPTTQLRTDLGPLPSA
eukprot:2626358-Pyramimonas_sp.AAC.1